MLMKGRILLLFFLLNITSGDVEPNFSCRKNGANSYKKFATKTPYAYIAEALGNGSSSKDQCKPVQFWTIVRHGTRFPSREAINFINNDLSHLRDSILTLNKSQLCAEDLEALQNWRPGLDVGHAKDLHPEGEVEMILLAERFQLRFPSLLGEDNNPEDFHFRATEKQRAQLSARSYATGLFSRQVANKLNMTVLHGSHDPLIRFYKLCPKWIRDVKKNPEAKAEFHLFSQSSWVEAVRKNVTDFLGLTGEEKSLNLSQVEQMYTACTFYQAWHPSKKSPWCAAFGKEDLEVMEYREDLEYYWVDGPAFQVTYQQACVLFADVYANFLNITKGIASEERGIFYFSHSGTLLKFIAFFRLFEDDGGHLLSAGYAPGRDWSWRTSRLSPFGANAALVLRQCGGSQFKVGLFVNEQLVPLPGCEGAAWCHWDVFSRVYGDRATRCDFRAICESDEATRPDEDLEVPDDKY